MSIKIRPLVFKVYEPEALMTLNSSNCVSTGEIMYCTDISNPNAFPATAYAASKWLGPNNPNGCNLSNATIKLTAIQDLSNVFANDGETIYFCYGYDTDDINVGNLDRTNAFVAGSVQIDRTALAGTTYTFTVANNDYVNNGAGKYLYMIASNHINVQDAFTAEIYA